MYNTGQKEEVAVMHPKFWLKTFLHFILPGGFGHYRRLRRYRDPHFDLARDKEAVRQKHHGTDGWGAIGPDGLRRREYSDYNEYLTHQKAKFSEILKLRGGFSNREIAAYRVRFFRRFSHLLPILPRSARILCAGARQGTEVEVLRDLGFSKAFGVDLNPGPDNPLVRIGDFMHLDEEDSSIDLVYSNCLDHSFDLDQFFAEHARVMKPMGYVLYDIALQDGGAFEAISWESEAVVIETLLRHFATIVTLHTDKSWKWILLQGRRHTAPPLSTSPISNP